MMRILIIEDDPAVAESVQFVLERNGYQTAHAENGSMAKKLLQETHFCGAIIDVWLGEEDGLEVLSGLRAAGNTLPVIVMSGGGPGRSLETVSTRADVLDAASMLFKPFTDDELLRAVSATCPHPGCST